MQELKRKVNGYHVYVYKYDNLWSDLMIELKDFTGNTFLLNSNLIERVESIPETKLILTTGKYILVQEDFDELINKIVDYNRRIYGAEREIRVVSQESLDD